MILAEARPAYEYSVKPAPRRTPTVAQPARRAVRRPAASPKTRYIVFWLVAVFLALGLASRFALAAKLTVDIGGLNKQLAALQAENQQLQLQASELKSLSRIEQVATTRLGMIRPTEARPLVVTGGQATTASVVADVSSPAGAQGGWIATVQRWLTKLITTGRAAAKGL